MFLIVSNAFLAESFFRHFWKKISSKIEILPPKWSKIRFPSQKIRKSWKNIFFAKTSLEAVKNTSTHQFSAPERFLRSLWSNFWVLVSHLKSTTMNEISRCMSTFSKPLSDSGKNFCLAESKLFMINSCRTAIKHAHIAVQFRGQIFICKCKVSMVQKPEKTLKNREIFIFWLKFFSQKNIFSTFFFQKLFACDQ